jgi:hypothetical protein
MPMSTNEVQTRFKVEVAVIWVAWRLTGNGRAEPDTGDPQISRQQPLVAREISWWMRDNSARICERLGKAWYEAGSAV